MDRLTHTSFTLALCQASLFTPEADLDAGRFMRGLYPAWSEQFDADPTILPTMPGLPREVPRVTLQSRSGERKCEVAPGRINIAWRRVDAEHPIPAPSDVFTGMLQKLLEYLETTGVQAKRLAAVVSRYAVHPSPGLFLARHFCKEEWAETPLNRPESFELHAHKSFDMGPFSVNSWVRNRTANLVQSGQESPILSVEQDINTVLGVSPDGG